jgi:hypothetical protein
MRRKIENPAAARHGCPEDVPRLPPGFGVVLLGHNSAASPSKTGGYAKEPPEMAKCCLWCEYGEYPVRKGFQHVNLIPSGFV